MSEIAIAVEPFAIGLIGGTLFTALLILWRLRADRPRKWHPGDQLRGDHGTHQDAVEFILDEYAPDNWDEAGEFLRAWTGGDLAEWPEYYEWLEARQ